MKDKGKTGVQTGLSYQEGINDVTKRSDNSASKVSQKPIHPKHKSTDNTGKPFTLG